MGWLKNNSELIFYISVSVGLAVSSLSFTVVSGLFEILNGFWILISIITGGIFCYVIADSIAKLSAIFPTSLGIRTYLLNGLGNRVSLLFSYMYILFIIMIGGIESYIFSLVVNAVFPGISPFIIILFLLLLIISINIVSFEIPRSTQVVLVTFLVISIAAIGISGIVDNSISVSLMINNFDIKDAIGIPTAIGMSMFLFVGFEWVTTLGTNAEAYKRKIPFSMKTAIVINTIMFSFFCMGILLNLSKDVIISSSIPQVHLAEHLFGFYGSLFALFISLLAILSTFNAGVLGGARFIYLLGREGYLPKATTKISYTTGVPVAAIILLGVLVSLCAVSIIIFEIELELAIICSSIICFTYAVLMLSLFFLNKNNNIQREKKGVRLIKYLVIVLLFVFGALGLFSIPEKTTFVILGFIITLIFSLIASTYIINKKQLT